MQRAFGRARQVSPQGGQVHLFGDSAACVAVIPARYGSLRLPGKPLALISGRPMVVHVLERVRLARSIGRVVVATDDARIAEAVRAYGGEAWMTSPDCAAGSDRVAEVASALGAEIVVNVQGDEPLLDPATLDAVVAALADPSVEVATAAAPLSAADAEISSKVKVVFDAAGRALYFSRAPIPHGGPWWVHLGIYAYRRATLLRFAALAPSPLERTERLEQLRLLEHRIPIVVVPVQTPARAVDTPEDLAAVRALFAESLSSPL